MLQLGHIDRADDKPPYRQISSMLREAIRRGGQLESGERLPSEAELIHHFGGRADDSPPGSTGTEGRRLVISEHGRGGVRASRTSNSATRIRPIRPATSRSRQGGVHRRG